MKTTDWKWGGSILGIRVRRHGQWCIGDPGRWFWFIRYATGITILKIGPFAVDHFPNDDMGVRVKFRRRWRYLKRNNA